MRQLTCVYTFAALVRPESHHFQDKRLTETPSDAYELWNSGLESAVIESTADFGLPAQNSCQTTTPPEAVALLI